MRVAWRQDNAFAAALLTVMAAHPAAAGCLDEAGFAALEASDIGGGVYRPLTGVDMPSDDYGYEIRQDANSFLVRSFRPGFVLSYVIVFSGDDALITARFTGYEQDDDPHSGSYTIYYRHSDHDYVTLCGNPGMLTVAPVLDILDHLRQPGPE
ncbi:MAG: hypothetical protein Q4G25_14115 [Paracoccus sp. (in: a-proteobacteria)]|nr:hypothetical protein [Paracoccus sp. (in: a-proteobacteria)]